MTIPDRAGDPTARGAGTQPETHRTGQLAPYLED